MKTAIATCAILVAAAASTADAAPKKRAACAGGAIERSICSDATLAGLAAEVRRLNAAAGGADKARRAEVAASDKAWRADRDACGAEYKDCLLEQHMARIAALRGEGASDPKGISEGPAAWSCSGLAETVMATTARSATPVAYLAWGQWSYALKGAQGAYLIELDEGPMRWSAEGGKATLVIPGRGELACSAGR